MEIDLFGIIVILIGYWQWRQTHLRLAEKPIEVTWRTSRQRTGR